jgi:hypothetical protein
MSSREESFVGGPVIIDGYGVGLEINREKDPMDISGFIDREQKKIRTDSLGNAGWNGKEPLEGKSRLQPLCYKLVLRRKIASRFSEVTPLHVQPSLDPEQGYSSFELMIMLPALLHVSQFNCLVVAELVVGRIPAPPRSIGFGSKRKVLLPINPIGAPPCAHPQIFVAECSQSATGPTRDSSRNMGKSRYSYT